MSRRWVLWFPLVLFGLIVMLVLWGMNRDRDDFVRSRLIGQPVPEFSLPPAVEGKPGLASTDLSDGKPQLVNFFGSWCIPCRAEAPQLAALAAAGVPITEQVLLCAAMCLFSAWLGKRLVAAENAAAEMAAAAGV